MVAHMARLARSLLSPLLPGVGTSAGDWAPKGTAAVRSTSISGTSITHDTLLLTVTQIGVCLISYQGDELALSQRMFRRDLRTVGTDPVEEAKDLLARRKERTYG